MKTYTLSDVTTYLDQLAANPDFAADVRALRTLVADGLAPGEIDFMMRGLFPINLISVLVEADRAGKSGSANEPVIEA